MLPPPGPQQCLLLPRHQRVFLSDPGLQGAALGDVSLQSSQRHNTSAHENSDGQRYISAADTLCLAGKSWMGYSPHSSRSQPQRELWCGVLSHVIVGLFSGVRVNQCTLKLGDEGYIGVYQVEKESRVFQGRRVVAVQIFCACVVRDLRQVAPDPFWGVGVRTGVRS